MISKKKLSGQTIAIIILAILLLLSVIFGGVYAFYSSRTNIVSGKIIMANLNISLQSNVAGSSEKSEIVISNGTNVVPNELLENSPLTVTNKSSVPIYLVVVYEVKAVNDDGVLVNDSYNKAVIDIGVDYYNPSQNIRPKVTELKNTDWVDYVFSETVGETTSTYRCLVLTKAAPVYEDGEEITVIPQNSLRLSANMGNEYQRSTLSFKFQAYAIASNSFTFTPEQDSNREYKSGQIVSAIYDFQEHKFLNIV